MYRIKDLREDRDLTQAEVARVIQTTQQQYSKIESGKSDISGEKLILLAKFYHVHQQKSNVFLINISPFGNFSFVQTDNNGFFSPILLTNQDHCALIASPILQRH